MLHTTETYIPCKGRLHFFWRKSCIFEKQLWYFASDSGKVNASISLVLRCNIYIYIIIFIPELCVYWKWSFTFWLWCIYYIAFNKGNTIHKVILKQKTMALHRDCMELDYIQELLNKHLTFWFGNFLDIMGGKYVLKSANCLYLDWLYLGAKRCTFLLLTTGPSLIFVHWWRGVLRMRAWRPRMLEERGMWNTMDNKKEHM